MFNINFGCRILVGSIYFVKDTIPIKNKVETGKVDNSSVEENNQLKEDDESENYYYEDVIDKEGKIKVKIKNELLSEAMLGDGFRIDLTNEDYLIFEGIWRKIYLNLKDYSVIIEDEKYNYDKEEKFIIEKVDKKSNIIWKYEKNNKNTDSIETELINNRIYVNTNGKITVLDIEKGKTI